MPSGKSDGGEGNRVSGNGRRRRHAAFRSGDCALGRAALGSEDGLAANARDLIEALAGRAQAGALPGDRLPPADRGVDRGQGSEAVVISAQEAMRPKRPLVARLRDRGSLGRGGGRPFPGRAATPGLDSGVDLELDFIELKAGAALASSASRVSIPPRSAPG
jgi:hypothetical protein